MFGTFLAAMLVSTSLAIYENKNPPKNYGWFQEDYWEQNDINSLDWDHPLRETPNGGVMDNLHLLDKMYEIRNEENSKGRYFPKDKKKKDKKIIIPPIPIEDNNKDTTNTLV